MSVVRFVFGIRAIQWCDTTIVCLEPPCLMVVSLSLSLSLSLSSCPLLSRWAHTGPYREVLSQIVHELEGNEVSLASGVPFSTLCVFTLGVPDRCFVMLPQVQMFVPTPNQRNNTGPLRDKFVPNPTYTNLSDHRSMFVFLGQLMGIALRTVS